MGLVLARFSCQHNSSHVAIILSIPNFGLGFVGGDITILDVGCYDCNIINVILIVDSYYINHHLSL